MCGAGASTSWRLSRVSGMLFSATGHLVGFNKKRSYAGSFLRSSANELRFQKVMSSKHVLTRVRSCIPGINYWIKWPNYLRQKKQSL